MAEGDLVCVVDDDDAARKSLSFLLGMAGFGVEVFDGGPVFLDSPSFERCGCLIADVRMPEMTGLELLRKAREARADLSIVVITGHGDIPLAVEAMKAGAADFIEKPFDTDRLVGAVRHALQAGRPADPRGPVRSEVGERLDSLSPREKEVMMSLVRGNPNKVVAYELGISARTVEVHRAHVMTKMQARSLADLVRMALVAGVLDDTLA